MEEQSPNKKKLSYLQSFLVSLCALVIMIVIANLYDDPPGIPLYFASAFMLFLGVVTIYYLWKWIILTLRETRKEKLKRNNKRNLLIVSIGLLGAFLFVWLIVRPANIRQQCHDHAVSVISYNGHTPPITNSNSIVYMTAFEACKNSKGL